MKIDITKLLNYQVNKITFNDNVDIPESYLNNTRIVKLYNVKAEGTIKLDEDNEINIIGKISGTMELQDDLTLEPVEYNFSTDFEEILNKIENILDIIDVLWQNILMEVPSKVRKASEDINLSGPGWRVISEDKYKSEREVQNNPFQDLDKLLEGKEEK